MALALPLFERPNIRLYALLKATRILLKDVFL